MSREFDDRRISELTGFEEYCLAEGETKRLYPAPQSDFLSYLRTELPRDRQVFKFRDRVESLSIIGISSVVASSGVYFLNHNDLLAVSLYLAGGICLPPAISALFKLRNRERRVRLELTQKFKNQFCQENSTRYQYSHSKRNLTSRIQLLHI